MKTLLLNRLMHGYEELEPVILGLMAMDKSFILIGRHGTGKTKLAKSLSRGFGESSFVFYDATKDDLISIAGIPDPESIKIGKLRFIGHERSIWDKTVIVVDEITRASKENQNLWLEILEERTCFGIPLKYRSIIATANPESYAAAFQLDEALLDRFYAVIPVPEMQSGINSYDIKKMVNLSMKIGDSVTHDEIIRIFSEIKSAYKDLINENALEKVERYLGEIIPPILEMLKDQNNQYMSPRSYCHILPEVILAIAAYFKVIGAAEPLRDGAEQALKYSVATRLRANPLAIEQHHKAASILLRGGTMKTGEKLRMDLCTINDTEAQLAYITNNWSSMIAELTKDELEKTIRKIYKEINESKNNKALLIMQAVLSNVGYSGDILRQVKGQLNASLFKARRKLLPVIQKYLLTDTNELSGVMKEKILLLESLLKDSKFITDAHSGLVLSKTLIMNISDKYDKPGVNDILNEISMIEFETIKEL